MLVGNVLHPGHWGAIVRLLYGDVRRRGRRRRSVPVLAVHRARQDVASLELLDDPVLDPGQALAFSDDYPPSREAGPSCRQAPGEEVGQLVEWDDVHSIVQIRVACARDQHELLRLRGGRVGGLAEVARVRLLAVDE